MTPPTVDVHMLHAKLRLLRELLDDLDALDQPEPIDLARLEQDRIARYAVERILTQLVDLAASANAHLVVGRLGMGAVTYKESFRWPPAPAPCLRSWPSGWPLGGAAQRADPRLPRDRPVTRRGGDPAGAQRLPLLRPGDGAFPALALRG